MEYGGLATIFKNDNYFICKETEEYVQKIIEVLDNNKKFNFEKITEKYTNLEKWKTKLDKIYLE